MSTLMRALSIVVIALATAAGASGATSADPTGGTDWSANAKALRGQIGQHYQYVCPAGGTALTVWGTDLYTDDSSVCTAAVHAGLITFANGGTVTVEIAAGAPSYTGSARNGVNTHDYGAWDGSYKFVGAAASASTSTSYAGSSWTADTRSWRGKTGQTLRFFCAAGGKPATIWGTTVYTDDSPVCVAAVHAGLISYARGGAVKVRVQPGQRSYKGSTHAGVTSRSYGSWPGSYVFVR